MDRKFYAILIHRSNDMDVVASTAMYQTIMRHGGEPTFRGFDEGRFVMAIVFETKLKMERCADAIGRFGVTLEKTDEVSVGG